MHAVYRSGGSGGTHVTRDLPARRRWACGCTVLLMVVAFLGLMFGVGIFVALPSSSGTFWAYPIIFFASIWLLCALCVKDMGYNCGLSCAMCVTCLGVLGPFIAFILESVYMANFKQIDFRNCSYMNINEMSRCGGKCTTEFTGFQCVCCSILEKYCVNGQYHGSSAASFRGLGYCDDAESAVNGLMTASICLCIVSMFLPIITVICIHRYKNAVHDDSWSQVYGDRVSDLIQQRQQHATGPRVTGISIPTIRDREDGFGIPAAPLRPTYYLDMPVDRRTPQPSQPAQNNRGEPFYNNDEYAPSSYPAQGAPQSAPSAPDADQYAPPEYSPTVADQPSVTPNYQYISDGNNTYGASSSQPTWDNRGRDSYSSYGLYTPETPTAHQPSASAQDATPSMQHRTAGESSMYVPSAAEQTADTDLPTYDEIVPQPTSDESPPAYDAALFMPVLIAATSSTEHLFDGPQNTEQSTHGTQSAEQSTHGTQSAEQFTHGPQNTQQRVDLQHIIFEDSVETIV